MPDEDLTDASDPEHAAAPAPDLEEADGDLADDEDAGEPEPLAVPMWKLVAGGVAVIVVVAIAVVAATGLLGGDDEGDGGDGEDAAAEPSVVDSFDRADAPNELGSTESGQAWESVSGTWGIVDDQAVLVEPNPDGIRSIAVVDVGAPDGTVSATAGTLTQGWGIVFRYRGAFNYWFLTAAPEFATYNLGRVVDGEVQNLGAIGLADVDDGAVVQVRMDRATIEISVNGTPVKAVTDTGLIGATQAGLLASGSAASEASWDAFEATPSRAVDGPSAVTPQTVAPGSSTTAGAGSPTTAAP